MTAAAAAVIAAAREIERGCGCEYDYRCGRCEAVVSLHKALHAFDAQPVIPAPAAAPFIDIITILTKLIEDVPCCSCCDGDGSYRQLVCSIFELVPEELWPVLPVPRNKDQERLFDALRLTKPLAPPAPPSP